MPSATVTSQGPPRWTPAETDTASALSRAIDDDAVDDDAVDAHDADSLSTRETDTRARYYLYAVYFLLSMSQALPMTATQVLLNRDLGFSDRPELVNAYFAAEFSASALKPAYALLSDFLPIFGKRRVPYMVLGAFFYAVSLQFYARVDSVRSLYASGIASTVAFAVCETGADGLLVQLSRGDSKKAMRVQAAGMLVRSAGSFTATALSVPLLAVASARTVIALAGIFGFAAAGAALGAPEKRVAAPGGTPRGPFEPSRDDQAAGGFGGFVSGRSGRSGRTLHARGEPLFSALAVAEDGSAEDGSAEDDRRPFSTRISTKNADGHARRVDENPDVRKKSRMFPSAFAKRAPRFTKRTAVAASFLFFYRLPPSSAVTFAAFAYAQFALPAWGFSAISLLSMVGGILATWGYRRLASGSARGNAFEFTLKTSFLLGATVNALCGLTRLGVVRVWNGQTNETQRAPVLALSASEFVSSGGVMFGYMPVLALAARVAPKGAEAFGFSMMVFVADVATSLGSYAASAATRKLRLGTGPDRSWRHLSRFIMLTAGFKLLPLALLPLAEVREESAGSSRGGYEPHEDEDEE